MYHPVSGSSKRIVTIQFPEVQIVLDFDKINEDRNGSVYPSITVFTPFEQGKTEEYLDSFLEFMSIEDILAAVCVDDWTDSYWLENVMREDSVNGRHFLTTFVKLPLTAGEVEG